MKRWEHWLPLVLFLVALGLRVWGATWSPPSPYWEEAALGYDAYSILRTGRDHHGNAWPIVAFPSFGDYKPALYFYTLVPAIALFGLNSFAVRLPAILASAGTVMVLYFLLKRWTNTKVAGWSSFVLAVQPWSWQVGRVGFETNLATFLLLTGALLLTEALDRSSSQRARRSFWFSSVAAAICFALSMYTYHGARVLAPLFALIIFGFNFNWSLLKKQPRRFWQPWIPAVLVGVVMVLPILLVLRTPAIQQRIAETSVFAQTKPVERSNALREANHFSLLSRVLYHRYWFWGETIAAHYLDHFSPQFLFGRGDVNPRHTSQWFGALYPWELLTILIGLAYGASHWRSRRQWWAFLTLTAAAPLAAALTVTTPHALRALPLSPWLAVLSGLGLVVITDYLSNRWLLIRRLVAPLTVIGILGSWLVLAFYFMTQYRLQYAGEWQYGYQQLFDQLTTLRQNNEPIFVSRQYGRPAMYLFFTQTVDPLLVQAEEESAPRDQLERLAFQNWFFGTSTGTEFGLHAVTTQPEKYPVLSLVNNLDGKPIWFIYRAN